MAKGKPVSCSLKPAKLVALLGLVLVLSGIGFGYLAFDAGVRAASGSSGGWQDAMLAATGTQQMVSATICVSIGARRRSATPEEAKLDRREVARNPGLYRIGVVLICNAPQRAGSALP